MEAVKEASQQIEDDFLELLREMEEERQYEETPEQEALEELREEEEALLPYLRQEELKEEQRYLQDNAYPAENYDPELLERMSRSYYDPYDVIRDAERDYYGGYQ